jgi:hypothetical protein
MTAHGLAPGGSETVTTTWEVAGVGDYGVSVVLNAPDTGLPRLASAPALLPLCQTPATADAVISIRDMPLYSAWNLISPPVQPFVTDLDVVQRPISGTYDVILGYDGESRSYRPGRPPAENTLAGMDASHGYWIRTNLAPAPPLTDTLQAEPVATLRIAGQALPADKSLALAAGWNLVGYLPHPTLPVTTALQSIAGSYTAALGFEQTGLSYYPDLDARFNTLSEMTAASGYWIKASRTVTLTYPATAAVSSQAVTITGALAPSPTNRLTLIRQTEESAGVSPTFEWMNFYGTIALPDGSTAPTGTVVLAVDPQSVVCGATELAYPGQYGLLACYRDDPYTAGDEGAAPGDTIRLVISADGKQADGQVIGTGTWAAHGSRQQVPPPRSVPRAYLPVIWQGGQRAYESWLPLIMRILRTMAAEPPAQEPFDSPIPAPDAVGLPDAEKQKGGNP